MSSVVTQAPDRIDAEKLLNEPPENMELVDGQLVEKTGMTFKHGLAQANLASLWRQYAFNSGQGGRALTETACRTSKQTRRPDVAYVTAEIIEAIAGVTTAPQSFPLIAEIASPDDKAEELFAKAREYLLSGCHEVWLLFPENQVVIITTVQHWLIFSEGATINTQIVLSGFQAAIADIFS